MINKEMFLADLKDVKKIPLRNGYGEGLVIAGEKNKNVVVLCADLSESTRSLQFQQKFPERFIEVGVAEQNMASLAAGMCLAGKIPFISSYAMFSPGRNWEQIRTTICYNEVNVKIGGAHAGISVGPDGATHQAIEDIAIIRPIPNMTVIVPCDSIEAKKATVAAAEFYGPCYIRFAREKTPVMTTDKTPFTVGKAEIFRFGEDIAIVACGQMVYEALKAAEELEKEGISAMVVNNHTIKPIDEKTLIDTAQRCGAIVTAEEHQINGGMGSAVAEVIVKNYPVPIKMVGVQTRFGESGDPEELMDKFGLRAKDIIIAAKQALAMKKVKNCVNDPFVLKSGEKIYSLHELYYSLKKMSDDIFNHHVNDKKNDFANWIKDSFKDQKLADAIKKSKTKEAIIAVVGLRINA
ncbi:MAG: transketolase C-terminal domain-containing protein [Candidatus Woesearchaeota archaeon]